jgi:hypothetical protein
LILHKMSVDELAVQIIRRAFALQSEVWYAIDDLIIKNNNYNPYVFFKFNNEPVSPAGLIYLMYKIADYNFVYSMRELGIRFTNGFPAITLISFGYFWGSFVQFILGIISGVFLYYLYKKVLFLQPIRLLIALIFFNNIYTNIFIMGEVYYIYKFLSVFCILFFLIDLIILKEKNIFLFKIICKRSKYV